LSMAIDQFQCGMRLPYDRTAKFVRPNDFLAYFSLKADTSVGPTFQ